MNITEVSELVCKSKDNYQNQLFKKLTNPLQTSSKTYKYILQWKRSCFSFFSIKMNTTFPQTKLQ